MHLLPGLPQMVGLVILILTIVYMNFLAVILGVLFGFGSFALFATGIYLLCIDKFNPPPVSTPSGTTKKR